jgi:hypothetical protein
VTVLPVFSTERTIAAYCGKYIGKDVAARLPEDKGARMVEYARNGQRRFTTRFAWNNRNARLWRQKLAKLAEWCGFPDFEDFRRWKGPRWASHLRERILAVSLEDGAEGDAGPARARGLKRI